MHVRLAFSVAAHLEPDILLVYEVLAVGDLEFQSKCLGKMEAVSREEGRTILFVSHDLSAIGRLCRRVVLLEGGEICAEGHPADVLDLYNRRATQGSTPGVAKTGAVGTIRIRDVSIKNQDRKRATGMRLGGSWVVEIRASVRAKLDNCIFGLGIQDHNGRSIQNTWLAPTNLRAGDYEVSFEAENFHLAPGAYCLVFGVLHGYETAFQGPMGELVVVDKAVEDFPPCITASAPVVNSLKTAIARIDR